MNFLNLVQGAAGKVKGVATLLSGLTKTQAIIAGVATVTAVGGVGTGGYFLYDHFHQPEPIVADVVISTEVAEEPTEEVVAVEEVPADQVAVLGEGRTRLFVHVEDHAFGVAHRDGAVGLFGPGKGIFRCHCCIFTSCSRYAFRMRDLEMNPR